MRLLLIGDIQQEDRRPAIDLKPPLLYEAG